MNIQDGYHGEQAEETGLFGIPFFSVFLIRFRLPGSRPFPVDDVPRDGIVVIRVPYPPDRNLIRCYLISSI